MAVEQDILGMLRVQQWINAKKPTEREIVRCGERLPILNAELDTAHLVAVSAVQLRPTVSEHTV